MLYPRRLRFFLAVLIAIPESSAWAAVQLKVAAGAAKTHAATSAGVLGSIGRTYPAAVPVTTQLATMRIKNLSAYNLSFYSLSPRAVAHEVPTLPTENVSAVVHHLTERALLEAATATISSSIYTGLGQTRNWTN